MILEGTLAWAVLIMSTVSFIWSLILIYILWAFFQKTEVKNG